MCNLVLLENPPMLCIFQKRSPFHSFVPLDLFEEIISSHPRKEKVNGLLVGRVKKKIGLKRHWLWALEPQRTRFLLPRLEHWGLNLSTNLMQISTDSLCILPPGRVKHNSGNASKLNIFSSRCMFTSCTQCLPSPSAPQSTWPWLSQWRGLKIKSYQFNTSKIALKQVFHCSQNGSFSLHW